MTDRQIEPSAEIALAAADVGPDGITGRALVEGLVNAGYDRRDVSLRVIALIDRGDLALGAGLRLFVRKTATA